MSIVIGNAVVGKSELVRTLIRFGLDGSDIPSSSTARLVPRRSGKSTSISASMLSQTPGTRWNREVEKQRGARICDKADNSRTYLIFVENFRPSLQHLLNVYRSYTQELA